MATCKVTRQEICTEDNSWHITDPVVVPRQCAQLGICAPPGSVGRLEKVLEFEWEKA